MWTPSCSVQFFFSIFVIVISCYLSNDGGNKNIIILPAKNITCHLEHNQIAWLRYLSYVIFLRSAFKFMPPGADNSLSRFMKNRTVPNKRMQPGFTMVEVVAVLVIVVVLAAAAIPRMMGTSDVAARVTADRVLAALHYAQVLAQRQGVPTSAVFADEPIATVTAGLTVYQSGVQVSFATQNYDGSTDPSGLYNVSLEPEVAFAPVSGVVAYGADGIPTAGAGISYTFAGGGVTFKIKVEQTGFAHFE